MKGGPPAPQLSTDIGVAINLFHGIETRYLEGWNRFGASVSNVAQAANPAGIKLRNPANSNVIAVVYQLAGGSNIADANVGVGHGASLTDYTTVPALTNTRLDPRGNPQPTLVLSITSGAQSPVAFGATIDNIAVAAALVNQRIPIIFTEEQEITILPGDALQIAGGVNNEVLNATFWWRERALEEGERT